MSFVIGVPGAGVWLVTHPLPFILSKMPGISMSCKSSFLEQPVKSGSESPILIEEALGILIIPLCSTEEAPPRLIPRWSMIISAAFPITGATIRPA